MTAQTINIDSTFTESCEMFPFNQNDTIYGLGVSGNVVLNSDTSLLRLIFVDGDYNEHLLYEAYPYISESWDFDISDVSDETKFLNLTQPHSIYVHLFDARIELDSLHIILGPVDFADSLQLEHKQDVEAQKITTMNDIIEEHEMIWFAAETSISSLSYSEKKAMFGENYNLLGFDYYAGGYYDPIPGAGQIEATSTLIPEFDWRNRHGANDTAKVDFYYDGDTNGGGWLTPIRNQNSLIECNGLCYIYSPLAVLEGLTNLYFNHHLDLNLAEQHVLECDDYNPSWQCTFGYADTTEYFLKHVGVVNDSCYPNNPPTGICNPCNEPKYHISIPNGATDVVDSIHLIKKSLIDHGPHRIWFKNYPSYGSNHFMALVGYTILQEGDSCSYSNGTNFIITANHPYEGKLCWIYKNSFGLGWGINGYMYHVEDQYVKDYCYYYELPVIDSLDINKEINCLDKDKDGYYNWGISFTKPDNCPDCSDERDSDDSEPRIGPYDSYYYGIPVMPVMEVTYGLDQVIPNGGFITFNNLSQARYFNITVKNPGNAQLNFEPAQTIPLNYTDIILSGPDTSAFTYQNDLDYFIGMNDSSDVFQISYDGSCSGSATCIVTIPVDEVDMEDFTFAIVFADCNHVPNNYTIQGQETWDGWRVIEDNYKVGDGGQLTITGHVGITEYANLVVDRGGTLIINGGHLINACQNKWKGIDVWGDATLSQYPTSNQGFLKVFNDGCIENADIAVQLTKENNDAPQSPYNGGIVRCYDAEFINNDVDVKFYSYNNFDPGTDDPKPNRSYFFNTRFINENICNKTRHVDVQNVDGIRFNGCLFKNTVNRDNCDTAYNIGIGIYSVNSGYYIKEHCYDQSVPCNNMELSRFENLEYGVYALNAGYNEFISIDTAIFYNTYRGIFMHSIDNPEIVRSQFIFDEFFDPSSSGIQYGTDLENCRYFTIEENEFKNTSGETETLGIQILNGGPYAHEVYNNYFEGLNTGITAAGENRNGTSEGLCIICNDFKNCITDIFVTPNGGTIPNNKGIARDQGDDNGLSDGPASNTFTIDDFSALDKNYNNDINNTINYFHHIEIPDHKLIPNPITTTTISLFPDYVATYTKNSSCPSNLGTGIDPAIESSTLNAEEVIIALYVDTLNQNIDGGNTQSLNTEVQTSFPNDALELKQDLLDQSPYLSDTVMKSAIYKENVLPNVMVKDILVANPQAAKSAEVLNAIDNKVNQMPDNMMSIIMQGKNQKGAKELLEKELAIHISKRTTSLIRLMNHYISDTINNWASDSLLSLMISESDPKMRYHVALDYLDKGDTISCFDILNNIPSDFNLTDHELINHTIYVDYINILVNIRFDTINPIDSLTYVNLEAIADNSNYDAADLARNLLISSNQDYYIEQVYLPDYMKSYAVYEDHIDVSDDISYLKVYPNPSKSYFIIEYDIDYSIKNPFIVITDGIGRVKTIRHINENFGHLEVETSTYNSGLHLVLLFNADELVETFKIQVIK